MKCGYCSGGSSSSVALSSLTLLPAGVPHRTYPTACLRSADTAGQGGGREGKAGRGRDEMWGERLQARKGCPALPVRMQGTIQRYGDGPVQASGKDRRLDMLPRECRWLEASELPCRLTRSAHANPAPLKGAFEISLQPRGRCTGQVLVFLSGN